MISEISLLNSYGDSSKAPAKQKTLANLSNGNFLEEVAKYATKEPIEWAIILNFWSLGCLSITFEIAFATYRA